MKATTIALIASIISFSSMASAQNYNEQVSANLSIENAKSNIQRFKSKELLEQTLSYSQPSRSDSFTYDEDEQRTSERFAYLDPSEKTGGGFTYDEDEQRTSERFAYLDPSEKTGGGFTYDEDEQRTSERYQSSVEPIFKQYV
ncbi:hypothetical protein [Vibrio agarivorans]|uniref:hypothetical protein n=1 Tax=Vibrio agarivorans TaxID=153622 RepID=UPI00222FEBA7|nr:hypothetical protein [Vibrio agarivorans]